MDDKGFQEIIDHIGVEPFYLDKHRAIFHGDCLDILPRLPDGCVDLVLTDPPYGINYQSARRKDKSQWRPKIKNDKFPFVWWLPDAGRVMIDPSALACFTRWDTEQDIRIAMRWSSITPKSQVIWDKEIHGMGDLNGDFAPQHENIIFAVKGNYKFPAKRPHSVIRAQRIKADALVHPNEKPVSLMRSLVESLCPAGGAILDPFVGGGSSMLGVGDRCAIGIELEEKYCEIAADRCANDVVERIKRGEY